MPKKLDCCDKFLLIKKMLQKNRNVTKICKEFNISRTLAYRLLNKIKKNPNRIVALIARNKNQVNIMLEIELRLCIINKVLIKNWSVQKTCKEYGISRTIFYRWLKRYKDAKDYQKPYSLIDKNVLNKLFKEAGKNNNHEQI